MNYRVAQNTARWLSAMFRHLRRLSWTDGRRPSSAERFALLCDSPTQMSSAERLFLYAFVRGRRPERVLEIGTYKGGSAVIICSALEENGLGRLIGVDPKPKLTVSRRALHNRFDLITRPSPEAIPYAREIAGGPFDLILIDGLHIYDQVRKDIEGCLPHAADGGYLLFHDGFHFGVREAIREAVEAYGYLHDCGYLCTTPDTTTGAYETYGGFRLLRVASAAVEDPQPHLNRAYQALGLLPPPPDPDLLNHNHWYCRKVQPCPYCKQRQLCAPGAEMSRNPCGTVRNRQA